ncbi:hypothetical protein Back2_26300 [Nocardioides baekrokdamisoli]|uniref:Hemerythrin-like domain-containing protein n=1 Tax=Nocardioides baekrokdamisoli TaxID=1804624 RepID=A0A3G9J125_9ACTN|nr:hemerythrin domain-containing protein [Nocardioides baekrokdamisoli]BBH18343.1 hypothetical protein Back2_26300 [Nocardioides baekrokdamisoli]
MDEIALPYLADASYLNMNDVIHAALRRDFERLRAATAALEVGDTARVHALREAWDFIWGELHHHHITEDRLVWPFVLERDLVPRDLTDQMEAEHQRMAIACGRLSEAFRELEAQPTTAHLIALRAQLEFAVKVAEEHLVHEERDVMPVLEPHWGTPAWKVVEREMAKVSPFTAGGMMAWLQDGSDPVVHAALRRHFPAALLWAASNVFGRAYHRTVAPVWR